MPAAEKFMFDTVFEDTVPVEKIAAPVPDELESEEPEPEEIVPTFSQEELEESRREGFQAGREEGQNASLDSIEKQISATLGSLESELVSLIENQNSANAEASHLALSVAVSIARKMLPEMASRNALNEIEIIVKEVLPKIAEEPRLLVHVHDDIKEGISARLENLISAKGFEGQMTVTADNELDVGDCRLEWSCGGANRNTRALWDEIDNIIARNTENDLLTESAEIDETPDVGEPADQVKEETNPEISTETDE